MRNTILTILAFSAALGAQSISRVQFRAVPGNLIEVTYTLADTEANRVYNIELQASLDGGFSFPITPASVTGDVGIVRGSGRKAILWKVLDDLPALTADALVFKVAGRNRITGRSLLLSLVSGNRLTKRMSNGVTLYGGRNVRSFHRDQAFRDLISDGMLLPASEGRAGLRVTKVPFIYKFEGTAQTWELGYPESTLQKLRLLTYGADSYNGEQLRLYRVGFAASMAYTPLPIFGLLLPSIGVGGALWRHSLGHEVTGGLSAVNSYSIFADVAVQVNVLQWLKVNVGGRQNYHYQAPRYDTLEMFIELGIHFN